MFKTSWLRGGTIYSDEGFSVALGRDTLAYREGKRRMAVTVDLGVKEVNVFQISIGRWDDDPSIAVNEGERLRIAQNIRRAIESQGLTVNLM